MKTKHIAAMLWCLLWLCPLLAEVSTPRIYWITFVDTTTGNVRQSDSISYAYLMKEYIPEVNNALTAKGYLPVVLEHTGRDTSPARCRQVVRDLTCGPEDIVVFYYMGHGLADADESAFPRMSMASRESVPLTWVHEQLRAKHARLTLAVGMCCNEALPGQHLSRPVSYATTDAPRRESERSVRRLQQLLLGYRGSIIAASSQPGERSWAYLHDDLEADYYTHYFVRQARGVMRRDETPTWDGYLARVAESVTAHTQRDYEAGADMTVQHPIHDVQVAACPVPADQQIRRVATPADGLGASAATLGYNLSTLVASGATNEVRRNNLRQMRTCFAPDATLTVEGQQQPVDAEKYMQQLGRERDLTSVTVTDVQTDGSGRVTSARLREHRRFYRFTDGSWGLALTHSPGFPVGVTYSDNEDWWQISADLGLAVGRDKIHHDKFTSYHDMLNFKRETQTFTPLFHLTATPAVVWQVLSAGVGVGLVGLYGGTLTEREAETHGVNGGSYGTTESNGGLEWRLMVRPTAKVHIPLSRSGHFLSLGVAYEYVPYCTPLNGLCLSAGLQFPL